MSTILSQCRQYRYQLSRNVDMFGRYTYAYFGINPSTADESINDHTVNKWTGFTKINDGKMFFVGNVFAYRATDIKALAHTKDPIGTDNDGHINRIIALCDILVPCWGSRDKLPESLHYRLDEIMERLKQSGKPLKVFGWCKSGDPMHPQMLSYKTELISIN